MCHDCHALIHTLIQKTRKQEGPAFKKLFPQHIQGSGKSPATTMLQCISFVLIKLSGFGVQLIPSYCHCREDCLRANMASCIDPLSLGNQPQGSLSTTKTSFYCKKPSSSRCNSFSFMQQLPSVPTRSPVNQRIQPLGSII